MYNDVFDNYFPEYIKNHTMNNWNYYKKGKELERYEIYKHSEKRYEYQMVIPLKYDSYKAYYKKKDDLINHLKLLNNLDYIEKEL